MNEKYNGHGGNESGEAEIPGVKSEIENRERESSLISEIEKDVGVVPSSAPVGVENTEEKDEQRSSDNSEESGLESGNETAVQENLSIDLVEVSLKWQGKPITVETAKVCLYTRIDTVDFLVDSCSILIGISSLTFKINVSLPRSILVLHTEINKIFIRFEIAEISTDFQHLLQLIFIGISSLPFKMNVSFRRSILVLHYEMSKVFICLKIAEI